MVFAVFRRKVGPTMVFSYQGFETLKISLLSTMFFSGLSPYARSHERRVPIRVAGRTAVDFHHHSPSEVVVLPP